MSPRPLAEQKMPKKRVLVNKLSAEMSVEDMIQHREQNNQSVPVTRRFNVRSPLPEPDRPVRSRSPVENRSVERSCAIAEVK